MENKFIYVLNYLMDRILAKTINMDELNEIIKDELDSREMIEMDNILITDCYFTLKHIEEEQIFEKEWIYFKECFIKKREYSVKDKFKFVCDK